MNATLCLFYHAKSGSQKRLVKKCARFGHKFARRFGQYKTLLGVAYSAVQAAFVFKITKRFQRAIASARRFGAFSLYEGNIYMRAYTHMHRANKFNQSGNASCAVVGASS